MNNARRQFGLASVLVSLLLGCVASFLLGRSTVSFPSADLPVVSRAGPAAEVAEALAAREAEVSLAALLQPTAAPSGADLVSEEVLREALRFSDDPDALLAGVIDGMSREELELLLSNFTGRDLQSLDEIADLHRFAKSYARIAMSGILTEAADVVASEVEFGARIADTWEAGAPQTVFESSQARLFGVFPLEGNGPTRLLAKWYRVDSPELLMLEEVPVLPQDGEAFVRFDRPEGWPQGDYRLELYAPGESFELVAAGDYQTRGFRAPRKVSFQ